VTQWRPGTEPVRRKYDNVRPNGDNVRGPGGKAAEGRRLLGAGAGPVRFGGARCPRRCRDRDRGRDGGGVGATVVARTRSDPPGREGRWWIWWAAGSARTQPWPEERPLW